MTSLPQLNLQPCCAHLRHKLMYCDARHATPGLVDNSSDTRVFFCTKTQDYLGPDDEPVDPGGCGSHRSCHETLGGGSI